MPLKMKSKSVWGRSGMKGEGWKEVPLGDIAQFKTGKLNSNAAVFNGKYPFFTCSPQSLRINDYAFDQKAILLAGNNAEGNFSIKYFEGKFNAYQRTYVIHSTNDKILALKYLYYCLGQRLNDFKQLSQGTSTKFLTVVLLKSFTIPLPPISEQIAISDTLSCLDDKIELNNRVNKTLEEMAQAIFKSWFVDFEPFQNGVFVGSELGSIPMGWRVGTLGEMAVITSGKRPINNIVSRDGENLIPVIGASGIMGYTRDVLFNEKIIITGRVGTHGVIQRLYTPCWASDNTLVIKADYYEYIYQFLKTVDYKSLNRGSTQPLITQTDLKNQQLVIPPKEILEKFEDCLINPMDLWHENNKQVQTLSKIRDTLLPKLMSGEIRVPAEEIKI